MQAVSRQVFCFAGFTLDLRRGCLRSDDREMELRPKSFEVLNYLVEHAGRLVAKDEFINAIWPNVIVSDESLTHCVSEVRRALETATGASSRQCHGGAICLRLRCRGLLRMAHRYPILNRPRHQRRAR